MYRIITEKRAAKTFNFIKIYKPITLTFIQTTKLNTLLESYKKYLIERNVSVMSQKDLNS